MNPEQLFKNLNRLGTSLSGKQIAGLASVFLAVCAVVAGSAYYLSVPTYTLLVTDMDAETSAAVVGRLRSERVPYELSDGENRTSPAVIVRRAPSASATASCSSGSSGKATSSLIPPTVSAVGRRYPRSTSNTRWVTRWPWITLGSPSSRVSRSWSPK